MNEPRAYYRRHLPHYQPEGATYHAVFRLAGSLALSAIEELRQDRERLEHELRAIKNTNESKKLHNDFRQKYFERFDAMLDGYSVGPMWLKQPEVASIVKEALHSRDGKEYDLLTYCIMPNHVHLVASVGRLSSRPHDATTDHSAGASDRTSGRAEARPTEPVASVGRLSSRPSRPNDKTTDHSAEATGGTSGRAKARPTTTELTNILRLIKGSTARQCNLVLNRSGSFWQHESYDHMIRDDRELERTIGYVLENPVKAGLVESWQQWPWTYVKAGSL